MDYNYLVYNEKLMNEWYKKISRLHLIFFFGGGMYLYLFLTIPILTYALCVGTDSPKNILYVQVCFVLKILRSNNLALLISNSLLYVK